MKKSVVFVLLLAVLAPSFVFGQTRPRRVGGGAPAPVGPAPARPATAPTPFPRSSVPSAPPQAGRAPQARDEVAEEVGEDEVVRVSASLVTVPVTVLDRDGRFISGLRQQDFRIFEDGAEQQVAYFASVEQPFTVALLIDTSRSTSFRLEDIHNAAIAFLDQLRPEDRVVVISFDDSVRVLSGITNDRGQLRDAIRRTRTGNGTRLYDAVDLAIRQQLSQVRGRKAMVLFTDGVDTTSKQASYQSTLAEAEELDALVYPIQYDTYTGGGGGGGGNWPPPQYPQRRRGGWGGILSDILGGGNVTIGGGSGGGGGAGTSRADYERGDRYLHELAALTGGRHHNAADLRYLEQAFTNIAEELRRQYSLGYYPSRQSQAAERRQIKVRVKRPNLVVRARDSYVYRPTGAAPADSTAQGNTGNAPVLRRQNLSRQTVPVTR
ncbi:MAG TPA: VWA domain-containing protein [Pyrinomonadaceae bacterium]|nr:VWA domain-containing protein [Pyrinomonadaceae bacterium]